MRQGFAPQDGQSLQDLTQLLEGAGDQVQATVRTGRIYVRTGEFWARGRKLGSYQERSQKSW